MGTPSAKRTTHPLVQQNALVDDSLEKRVTGGRQIDDIHLVPGSAGEDRGELEPVDVAENGDVYVGILAVLAACSRAEQNGELDVRSTRERALEGVHCGRVVHDPS